MDSFRKQQMFWNWRTAGLAAIAAPPVAGLFAIAWFYGAWMLKRHEGESPEDQNGLLCLVCFSILFVFVANFPLAAIYRRWCRVCEVFEHEKAEAEAAEARRWAEDLRRQRSRKQP